MKLQIKEIKPPKIALMQGCTNSGGGSNSNGGYMPTKPIASKKTASIKNK